jgi:hypothetical protein
MLERPPAPSGLVYQPDLITQTEEQQVLGVLEAMEFHPVTMHGQTARRTVRHFGLTTAMDPGSWCRPNRCRGARLGCRSVPRRWPGWIRRSSPSSSSPGTRRGRPVRLAALHPATKALRYSITFRTLKTSATATSDPSP